MLRYLLIPFSTMVLGNLACSDPSSGLDERKAAVERERKVIFNNDGNDAWVSDAPATPEGFLSIRQDQTDGCGVNSVTVDYQGGSASELTVGSVELSVSYRD